MVSRNQCILLRLQNIFADRIWYLVQSEKAGAKGPCERCLLSPSLLSLFSFFSGSKAQWIIRAITSRNNRRIYEGKLGAGWGLINLIRSSGLN